jgi:hypothetical protein
MIKINDIQRSKDIVHVLHDSRDVDTNLSLVLSTILSKRSCLKKFLDEKCNQGFCFRTNLFKKYTSTNDNDINSLVINMARSFSNYLC